MCHDTFVGQMRVVLVVITTVSLVAAQVSALCSQFPAGRYSDTLSTEYTVTQYGCQLRVTQPSNASFVLLGVVDGNIAIWNGATGTIGTVIEWSDGTTWIRGGDDCFDFSGNYASSFTTRFSITQVGCDVMITAEDGSVSRGAALHNELSLENGAVGTLKEGEIAWTTGESWSNIRLATLSLLDASIYPAARCLDGSPAGYYWLPASAPANDTKWIIRFQSGGECIDLDDCNERATTVLGTSTLWAATETLTRFHLEQHDVNPDFHSWNKVYIKYCSGDLFLGMQNISGITLPDLQFSGHHILTAILAQLREGAHYRSLDEAEVVVVSGESAGARAAIAYLDFVAESLPESIRVVGAPIAGWGFSQNWTYAGSDPPPAAYKPWTYADFEVYYHLWNTFVPERCAAERPLTPWQCILPDAFYSTLRTPVFVMNAQTDYVVMPLHTGMPKVWNVHPGQCRNGAEGCPDDILDFMHEWHKHLANSLQQLVDGGRGDGLFNPACLLHTTLYPTGPFIEGMNYLQAFGNWFFKRGAATILADDCGGTVLCNPTCPPYIIPNASLPWIV